MKVVRSACGTTFTIQGGDWSGTYAIDRLPAQLAFYRSLRDRLKGRFASHHAETVANLEALLFLDFPERPEVLSTPPPQRSKRPAPVVRPERKRASRARTRHPASGRGRRSKPNSS